MFAVKNCAFYECKTVNEKQICTIIVLNIIILTKSSHMILSRFYKNSYYMLSQSILNVFGEINI